MFFRWNICCKMLMYNMQHLRFFSLTLSALILVKICVILGN